MRLRIETFGHFAVRYGDREVVLNGRKARALLGYLALAEACQETRERLVGLLWSETEEAKARASLRQTLYEIREAFERVGFDKFDADKHITKIDRDALEVDLWEVMAGAKRGEPHAILLERDRATESLLSELEAVDPSFRGWLLAKRQSLHDRLVAHLEDALRRQTDAASDRGEEQVARALMKLDPTHEEAARALVRTRAAAGDMAGALGIYKALWNLLENEYDVEPSKETQELIAGVKLGGGGPGRGSARAVAHVSSQPAAVMQPAAEASRKRAGNAKLVVAVADFDTVGTREQHRYLVQGFRRELIASLRALPRVGGARSGARPGRRPAVQHQPWRVHHRRQRHQVWRFSAVGADAARCGDQRLSLERALPDLDGELVRRPAGHRPAVGDGAQCACIGGATCCAGSEARRGPACLRPLAARSNAPAQPQSEGLAAWLRSRSAR